MKFNHGRAVLVLSCMLELGCLLSPLTVHAGNLTVVKDTVQSSRLSFSGRVASGTPAGGSLVYINAATSGNFTSISTNGLKPNDSITINANTYTIVSIFDANTITVSPVLQPGDNVADSPIYYRAKPVQTFTFTNPSAVANGFFQILIPAAASNGNDQNPDAAGFDLNGGTVTLTPTNATGYTFITALSAATASGATGCTSPANYHCLEFHYSGNGAVNSSITITVGAVGSANNIIAPAPKSSRTASTADSYKFIVKNFINGANPNSALPVNDGQGAVAFIEGVRVTATVDPTITFLVEGVAASTSVCNGLTTSVTSTSYTVPFGTLANLDTFYVASQKLTVSTNAVTGYAVTAIENERMSNGAASPSYIPDTQCDTGACTDSTTGAWATAAAHPGLGYTTYIAAGGGTPTISPTAPNYLQFPSFAASEAPHQIMSNSTIASSQAINVCYKISVDATQPAGDYENQITYTATASF